jgi:hypothetical protein
MNCPERTADMSTPLDPRLQAKPFDRKEVIRIFSLAWLYWHDQHETSTGTMKLLKLASGM